MTRYCSIQSCYSLKAHADIIYGFSRFLCIYLVLLLFFWFPSKISAWSLTSSRLSRFASKSINVDLTILRSFHVGAKLVAKGSPNCADNFVYLLLADFMVGIAEELCAHVLRAWWCSDHRPSHHFTPGPHPYQCEWLLWWKGQRWVEGCKSSCSGCRPTLLATSWW